LQPHDLELHSYLKFQWAQDAGRSARRVQLKPANGDAPPVVLDIGAALQTTSFDVLLRAAVDGAGITFLSRLLIAPYIARGELVHLLPDWIFGRFTIYAALPTRKLMPARTKAFLEFLTEQSRGLGAPR
jgi:DNA-binding transcriptional LysR family regulator